VKILKNNNKVTLLLILMISFSLSKSIDYFDFPEGRNTCEKCLRLPFNFGKRFVFQQKMISLNEIKSCHLKWWRKNGNKIFVDSLFLVKIYVGICIKRTFPDYS
jgi:hypothetical protein